MTVGNRHLHTLPVEIQNSLQRVARSSKILYALTLSPNNPISRDLSIDKMAKVQKKLIQVGFAEGTICNKNKIKILETTQMCIAQE